MMKIKKMNIILGLMFSLPLNTIANVSNTGAIKNEEFSNKTSEELDMNHRFSLSKNSFDLKNDLFEIKIDKEVSFNKRYDTVEFLEKNFAIGKTEVELDKIKYNGIFGEVIAKNQEEFKQKLKENKKNLKVKQENKAKVIVTENAKEYSNRVKEILNKHNVDTNKNISAFIFKEDQKTKILTVSNKKVSIQNLKL